MSHDLFFSSSFDGDDEDDVHGDATSDGHTTGMANGGSKDMKIVSLQIPPWLSESTPDEFVV